MHGFRNEESARAASLYRAVKTFVGESEEEKARWVRRGFEGVQCRDLEVYTL